VNRTDALAYLKEEYTELSTEAAFDADGELRVYSRAIDRALRDLGTDEASIGTATVTDHTAIIGFLALLDYYALERYARVFATRTDVSVSGALSAAQSQTFKQVMSLRKAAVDRLVQLGLGPVEQFASGRLNLDFLEPSESGGEFAGDPMRIGWGYY
jgi:hypothetical protein